MRYSFILLAILCTACGTALPTVKPYKLDVQQGNVVTSKMLLQLRPGMTKSQVRFIMGTPLIQDSFHDKRWDYVYQLR
ncbi:MAG: outer membrane protein assembly factor BamE, partial [Pseudomonadota bacterium]